MKKNFIIIAAVILIGVSLILGYRKGLETPRPSILETSKVIQARYATAQGEITAIQDRTVIMASQGDTLSIPMAINAKLVVLVLPQGKIGEAMKQEVKEIQINDIKVGDEAVVQLEFGENGAFKGISLTILP